MPDGPISNNSVIFGNCIECGNVVRVPAGTNVDSTVRCPHCSKTFSLREVLNQAAPELEIVESAQRQIDVKPERYIDKELSSSLDELGKFVVPSQLAKGARRRSRRKKSGPSRRQSRSSSSESRQQGRRESDGHSLRTTAAADNGSATATEPRAQPVRRPAPKQSRSAPQENFEPKILSVELIKLAAGAVVALPVAYMVVMWLFLLDPLGLAVPVGRIAPSIVPSKFRTDDTADDRSASPSAVDTTDETPTSSFNSATDSNIGSQALEGLE